MISKNLQKRMNSEGFGPAPAGGPKKSLEEMIASINSRTTPEGEEKEIEDVPLEKGLENYFL